MQKSRNDCGSGNARALVLDWADHLLSAPPATRDDFRTVRLQSQFACAQADRVIPATKRFWWGQYICTYDPAPEVTNEGKTLKGPCATPIIVCGQATDQGSCSRWSAFSAVNGCATLELQCEIFVQFGDRPKSIYAPDHQ